MMKHWIALGALLSGALALPVPKSSSSRLIQRKRVLVECETHLADCEADLSNYSLPLLLYQAAFPPAEEESTTVATASKKDHDDDGPKKKKDDKKDDEDETSLLSQVLGALLFVEAKDDGPIRNVVYWVNDLGDEVLHDIFTMLNLPNYAFLPMVALLPPAILALSILLTELDPDLKLQDLVPNFNITYDVGNVDSDDVIEMLYDVVEDAKQTGTIDESKLPMLVDNLYDMIFELEPKDVAVLITLPFFVATADEPSKPGDDKPKKDMKPKKGDDGEYEAEPSTTVKAVSLLLGVPIIVLVTRTIARQLVPDLIPSNVIPEFPIIDRLFFSNTEADVFADATMTEVQTILVEANITGAEGLFSDNPEGGTEVVDLFMGRAEATIDDFGDDPVSTAVRVVATSVITSQNVLTRFAPLLFSGETDPAETVLGLLDFNTTDPEVAADNVLDIVQANYPAVASYGNFFVSVTKNILDTAVPGYFTGTTEERGPIKNLLGGLFETTDSCEVDLTSCQASLLLAEGLTRELNEDDEAEEPEVPLIMVAPLKNTTQVEEDPTDVMDNDDVEESSTNDAAPINMIQDQSSSTLYAAHAGFVAMAAIAIAF